MKHGAYGPARRLSGAAGLAVLISLAPTGVMAQARTRVPPEFGGLWRSMGAEAAPWFRSTTRAGRSGARTAGDLVFQQGAVRGPGPFSCSAPLYTVVFVPPEGLFQGGLAGRDAADDADRMGFGEGKVRTLRVDCRNATFDFHLAGPTTLKVALDNMILTFERRQ